MYKNWQKIATLTDPWLRMSLTLCNDSAELRKFQAGFPELFSSEETTPFIPLSVLCDRAVEKKGDFLPGILKQFGISYINWGSDDDAISTEVPPELWDMYMSLPYDDTGSYRLQQHRDNPIFFEWKGEKFVILDANKEFPDEPTEMYIAPARFIDFSHQ